MSATTIYMKANKQISLQEVYKKINGIEGSEEISKTVQRINDVEILTLVYEKYYFRTSGYVGLTVVLTEYGQEQTACLVASNGGGGMEKLSLGANRDYTKACVQILEECGFSAVESE